MHNNGKDLGSAAPVDNAGEERTTQWEEPLIDADIKLDEAAQALIGHHLKTIYGEIIHQPIPDQFLELLDDLERKERGK